MNLRDEISAARSQCQINDDGKYNRAEVANSQTVGLNSNCCQGAGGEGNDSNYDGHLCHRLCFYFEGEFHAWSRWQRGECKMDSRESVAEVLA